MVNDSSLGEAKQLVFDLNSQKGITHLLASVRASKISPAEKNELRDLIFLYSNGGRDESVRITLEQKIVFYAIDPVLTTPTSVVAAPKQALPFGASRPSPTTFSATAVTRQVVNTAPIPTVEVSENVPTSTATQSPVVPVAQQPQAVEVNVPVPTSLPDQPPAPIAQSVIPEPMITPPSTPAPPPVTNQESIVQAPAVPVAEVQPSATTVEAQTAVPANYDPAQALHRIREIKSIVNEKVGNPVNLVDIDNNVGREYMGALLDAMKKLNTGSSAVSAMKRLEAAFVEVERTLEAHAQSPVEQTSPSTPPSIPTPDSVPESPAVPQSVSVSNTPTTPLPDVVSVAPADRSPRVIDFGVPLSDESGMPSSPSSASYPTNASSELPVMQDSRNLVASAWGPSTDTVNTDPAERSTVAPVTQSELVKPETVPPPKVEHTVPTPSVAPNPVPTPVSTQTPAPPPKAVSLAQSGEKPRTLNDLLDSSAIETSSVAGDPLFTKDVDDGLNQLLVEWSLFKKSGLFGSGPKGREHPLFKKLAPLQIPLLLAGRFEGATQEIKQSITDYMNGWRYEQGIVYESGESFEHYLRRVIRHILDLQK